MAKMVRQIQKIYLYKYFKMNHNRYNSIYKKNYFLLIFFIILSIFSVIRLIDTKLRAITSTIARKRGKSRFVTA